MSDQPEQEQQQPQEQPYTVPPPEKAIALDPIGPEPAKEQEGQQQEQKQ